MSNRGDRPTFCRFRLSVPEGALGATGVESGDAWPCLDPATLEDRGGGVWAVGRGVDGGEPADCSLCTGAAAVPTLVASVRFDVLETGNHRIDLLSGDPGTWTWCECSGASPDCTDAVPTYGGDAFVP